MDNLQSSKPSTKQVDAQTKPSVIDRISQRLGPGGTFGTTLFIAFLFWLLLNLAFQSGTAERYALLKEFHRIIAWAGLIVASIMALVAFYIGVLAKGDVTHWFRSGTYTIFAFMLAQGVIGGVMYLMGGRAPEEVHIIYGYGVVLSLPFFIFVETTAKKRPAMGSYIWGFVLLAAIIVRCISTGVV